jgi:hypothetical protein
MADTGKQSPLGVNVIGSYLLNQGLSINPVSASYMGASKTNSAYTFGSLVSNTSLRMLTWAINDGYLRGVAVSGATKTLSDSTYNNLISIGAGTVPALGNAKPPTYVATDPSNNWARPEGVSSPPSFAEQFGRQSGYSSALPGPATSGYGNYDGSYGDPLQGAGVTNQKQNATWLPYDTTNPNSSITQWGYIRLHALQAWNEFNWNGLVVDPTSSLPVYLQNVQVPEYKEFLSSFLSAQAFIDYTNQAIMANQNAKTFLDGAYSNMDDLMSADIYGINLANTLFGADLDNLGKVINLSRIDSFGLPSVLLQTLGQNNAVIQDLVLALLSSGLESSEVQGLISGTITTPTVEQEQEIYSAFLMIIGENLEEVLAPLQCTTQGLTSLAELLDVKKLFPNSYQSLTVPKYNSELGLPTNSKTYYPLYISGGLNEALMTADMNEYVGTQTPNRPPNIIRNRVVNTNNISMPKTGFGSYLFDILPKQQAVAAGAFSFTMRQVKNIERVDIKKFSRAVKSLENTRNLNLVNGTSKPTNQESIENLQEKEALGTGPYGTYTMSDFFGSMSGLPYPWEKIFNLIKNTETSTLYGIYKQLFLAVTWEQATATVQYSSYVVNEGTIEDPILVTYYTITGITLTDPGGGYGRGGAPAPLVTLSNGGTAVALIGTNDMDAASVGAGSFGRITQLTLTSPGPDTTTIPTITIQCPPVATPGTNTASGTAGWPTMNTYVQNYIVQANAEIANIAVNNTNSIKLLNTYWNILGGQLAIEQRSRYIGLPPVSVPKDLFLNTYPTSINIFVDSIPTIAQDTKPHMFAQTLEAISNLSTLGGQSAVAQMRQERNQQRLISAGIPLDNNISTGLSSMDQKTLTTNNTIPAGINNAIESPTLTLINASPEIYGNVTNGAVGFTTPAWSTNKIDGQILTPESEVTPVTDDNSIILTPVPGGVYVPSDTNLLGDFIPALSIMEGDISPILNGNPVPVVNTIVPAMMNPAALNQSALNPAVLNPATLNQSSLNQSLNPAMMNPTSQDLSPTGAVNTAVDNSNLSPNDPANRRIVIVSAPNQLDTNIPLNLDIDYTGSTMLPATYSINEAIDKVIECNCDCWID